MFLLQKVIFISSKLNTMKKLFLLFFISVIYLQGIAQTNPRPTASRFYNNKLATFGIKAGDSLLYKADFKDGSYAFILTVSEYGDSIKAAYEMPLNGKNLNLYVSAEEAAKSTSYQLSFTDSLATFTNRSTLWLSKKNYRELVAVKETSMDFGNGSETFIRKSVATRTINLKGKEKIVTVYKISNTNQEHPLNFDVLTDLNNPLIVYINNGCVVTLKEVR